jgi:ketosteroid isomerase-like protein
MSQENVEVVRASLEAFNRGDLDSSLQAWDTEGEWRPAMAGAVEGKVYRGHVGLREYFEDLFTSFSEVRVDDLELRDRGDLVLALYQLSVRGHDSDAPAERPGAVAYEVRAGKIVHGTSYLSHAEALEAAGLSSRRCRRRTLNFTAASTTR